MSSFPPAAPQPAPARPGKTLPVLALVSAIVGVVVVALGFASFAPGVGRVLGLVSLAGWLFLIAGLVMAIVALVRRAASKGISLAALIVSIAGGIVGFAAGVIVVISLIAGVVTTVADEYGRLVPGEDDAAIQRDCESIMAAEPGTGMSDPQSVIMLLHELAAGIRTDAVGDPLSDLADAYEEYAYAASPDDMTDAEDDLAQATEELALVCDVHLDDLP
ncbi:hypothetical protein ACEK07_03970 [Alcanivoracaceae bacterium MT1]